MDKIVVIIKSIPKQIKVKIVKHLRHKILFVGYKKISAHYRTPIIELSNKQRIWILRHEIQNSNKL